MRQRKEINKQQLFKYHLLTTMRQQQMPHTEHNHLTFTISLNLYKTCDTGILLLLHDGKRMRLREFKKYAQNEQSCLDLNPDRAPQSAPSLAFHTQYQGSTNTYLYPSLLVTEYQGESVPTGRQSVLFIAGLWISNHIAASFCGNSPTHGNEENKHLQTSKCFNKINLSFITSPFW